MNWTVEEYEKLKNRNIKAGVQAFQPKPSKYHAVITECDGIKFQSKKEAEIYRQLCCWVHAGEIKFFLMQVPFRLAGGYKHLLDFLIMRTDGSVEYLEVKGRDLPMGKMKRKMVEAEYKINITVV